MRSQGYTAIQAAFGGRAYLREAHAEMQLAIIRREQELQGRLDRVRAEQLRERQRPAKL